jgi:FKBP-type peptidyl-prolyl cis-trans isomerase
MPSRFSLPTLFALGLFVAGCGAQEVDTSGIPDAELGDQASYLIGYGWADGLRENVERDSIPVDFDLVLQGVREGLRGDSARLTDEQMQQVMTDFQTEMTAQITARQEAQRAADAARGTAQADSFLTANADAEGVVTTESGLQYVVLEEGDGPSPTPGDEVTVNYEGKLINGEVFDASARRGQPATFGVTQVIPGWTEGLQLMQVGSTYRFHVPPDLAYGERGRPGIPPNSLLIFEVELLGINEE